MGLTRICNGNRNQEGLLPSIKDTTTDIPGRDGQYYFYSTFDKKQFTINYAFDALTEVEVDRIKVWLGDKKLHQLGFAEDIGALINPQVSYTLKPNGPYSITGIFVNESRYSKIEEFFQDYGKGQYSLVYKQSGQGAGQTVSLICPSTEIDEGDLFNLGISFTYTHPSKDGDMIVGYIDVQIIEKGLKKYYTAKVTSQSILKYIPFDNDISSSEDGDIYKGEGSIQFTCYYPFARKQEQYLQLGDNDFLNINSYIKFVSQEDINSKILFEGDQNSYVEIGTSYIIPQTCAPMPWKLIIELSNVEDVATLQIDTDTYNINFNKLSKDILMDKDNYRIIFNSKKGTIEAQKKINDDNWETITQSSKYKNRVGLPVLFNRIIDNKTLKSIPKGNSIDISLSVPGILYWEEVAY